MMVDSCKIKEEQVHFRLEKSFLELAEAMCKIDPKRFNTSKVFREMIQLGFMTVFTKGYLNVDFKYLKFGYDFVEREISNLENLEVIRNVIQLNKLNGGKNE